MIKRHNKKNQAVLYDLIVGLQLHPVCHELDAFLELCKYVVKNARTRKLEHTSASVAEWLRAWDTLTMFEATVCGRS